MSMTRRHSRVRQGATIALALGLSVTVGAAVAAGATKKTPAPKPKPPPAVPSWSSSIALSLDNKLVWSVNPNDDSVSVIRTDRNTVVKKIKVGDEPQSVALDPSNRYAYVANAAGSSLSVIRITNANPGSFKAALDTRFGPKGRITTGAEPWNVVASPNGLRVFVANSGQDTITVLDVPTRKVVGYVNLAKGACSLPDRNRQFQPRGMAITKDSKRLYVTRFLSFTSQGGTQADDRGRAGLVCRLDLKTSATGVGATVAQPIPLQPQTTGFTIDSTGDGVPDPTAAFPNQLQSIVIRGNTAYLPNVAASPSGPLRFNVDTQAFVNTIDGVNGNAQIDSSAAKFLNLHLGARNPETGKKRIFFANVWAIAFAPKRGEGPIYGNGKGDAAYVVSAGSDLLVKVNVDGAGKLSFTGDADTTRYIDLNDPANPATSGVNAGKNPQGIVINKAATRAYAQNFVSRNVSVVNTVNDTVIKTIKTTPLASPGSLDEIVEVGAEVFFSSRGSVNRPPGTTVSTTDRLSSEGWQSCSSCHFKGWTDGVVWAFGTGPRKSVPLNASWAPKDKSDQRVLNYSAIFDEVEDFELNIRNVSGPGNLAAAQPCQTPAAGQPATSAFDPNHGLLIADDGNINQAPCAIAAFTPPNAGRQQLTVTLPGSGTQVPALTAMKEWVRFAVRTPNGPLTSNKAKGGSSTTQVSQGRNLFIQAGCANCHGGAKWTVSRKSFTSPPAAADIATERTGTFTGNPVGAQYLPAFLRNIGSFNLGVAGAGNPIGNNIGGVEKASAALNAAGVAQPAQDALGFDYNNDGKGNGYNVPSLLGLQLLPPYYHNGACETLACVVGNVKHRTANGTLPDRLVNPSDQAAVVRFLETIGAGTAPVGP